MTKPTVEAGTDNGELTAAALEQEFSAAWAHTNRPRNMVWNLEGCAANGETSSALKVPGKERDLLRF